MIEDIDLSNTSYQFQRLESVEASTSTSKPRVTRLDDAYYQPSFARFWRRKFWLETVHDLKSIRWKTDGRRFSLHFLFLMWLVFLITWAIVLPAIVASSSFTIDLCRPDGIFSTEAADYKYFEASEAFVINFAFGSFKFSDVKLIDITWDVIVGRGGQGLCCLVTYYVMSNAITRLMEVESVPRSEFEAVTMHYTSFTSLFVHIKNVFQRRSLRATFLAIWFVYTCAFVLTIPTWLSAMTGYTVKVNAYIEQPDGNLVLAKSNSIRYVYYVIHDASRLGLPDDFAVNSTLNYAGVPADLHIPSSDSAENLGCEYVHDQNNTFSFGRYAYNADMICAISEYTSIYGFYGLNQSSSTLPVRGLRNTTLSAPVLNISLHFDAPLMTSSDPKYNDYVKFLTNVPPSIYPYGLAWIDPTDNSQPFLQHPEPRQLLGSDIQLPYSISELNKRGSCNAAASADIRYQWGFSALLLEIFVVVMVFWSLGMYATHMDAFVNSRLVADGRTMGSVRAAIDIANAMSERLSTVTKDIDLMSDYQLKQATRGVRLNYWDASGKSSISRTRAERIRLWWRQMDLKVWALREKLWLCLALILVILSGALLAPLGPISLVLILFALSLGPKRRSRWLLLILVGVVSVFTLSLPST